MTILQTQRFAIIGAGNIGCILLERLRAGGVPTTNLAICDTDRGRQAAAAARFGCAELSLADNNVSTADMILITVPPPTVCDVVRGLGDKLHSGQIVISFAAAVSLYALEAAVPRGVAVVRVMPTAPSLVGQGMNPVAFGALVTPRDRVLIEALLATLGESIVVSDDQMNWCVGLAGAAMRSLLPVLEGMTEAGLQAGFTGSEARRIAGLMMQGTAALVLQKPEMDFAALKNLTPMVTVDEVAVAREFHDAAQAAREKVDALATKICHEH